MGYERNDRRYGTDRDRYEERNRYQDPSDRGFFDRAGDEVRSWFGDEEAERRRRLDERYDERAEREGYRGGGYDRGYDRTSYGYDRDRGGYARGSVGGYTSPDRYPTWARSNRDEGFARGYSPRSTQYQPTGADRQFEGGYPGDGSYGRHSYADTGFRTGGEDWRDREYRSLYGDDGRRAYGQQGGHSGDEHGYRAWRDQQVSAFDRDYDEYRREHQSRFHSEFANWRQNRQTQRDSLHSVQEHQEVVGSDGVHVGKVDHVRGDRILLTKTDKDAGGHHHSIPSSWIQSVSDKVTLARTAAQAQQAWRDEETNRGLFSRTGDDQDRGDTRTDLNRSFSGTY